MYKNQIWILVLILSIRQIRDVYFFRLFALFGGRQIYSFGSLQVKILSRRYSSSR